MCGSLDDCEATKKSIDLDYARCHFGKQQPHFIYRYCYNIVYANQSEALRSNVALCKKTANGAGRRTWYSALDYTYAKGLLQQTYQRKRFKIRWCQNQDGHYFIEKFEYLLNDEGRNLYFGST